QVLRPTVVEDVRFGLALDDDGVNQALADVGLDPQGFRDRRIDDLSGGEQRRVALAGVIARRPRLLVLDEPLAGLDAPSRRALIDVLHRLTRSSGVTTVLVTHDTEDAQLLADRALLLADGRIVADGPVSD